MNLKRIESLLTTGTMEDVLIAANILRGMSIEDIKTSMTYDQASHISGTRGDGIRIQRTKVDLYEPGHYYKISDNLFMYPSEDCIVFREKTAVNPHIQIKEL